MSEAQVLREVEIAIGSLPDLWVHRNQVGLAEHHGRTVRYGLGKGSPDLICALEVRGFAVMFGLEVKTATGRLSPDQLACHGQWELRKIRCFVVRSGAEALAAVERMRRVVWAS